VHWAYQAAILRYLPWSKGVTNLPQCDTRREKRRHERQNQEREKKPVDCARDSKICLDHSSRSHSEAPFFLHRFSTVAIVDRLSLTPGPRIKRSCFNFPPTLPREARNGKIPVPCEHLEVYLGA